MRTARYFPLATLAAIFAAAAIGADSPSRGVQVGGVEAAKSERANAASEANPTRAACINHCDAADTRCNSDVRRSRQECSRRAATGGHDPMSSYRDDYTYFCGYFQNVSRCGSDAYASSCEARYQRHYSICIDLMQDNVMGMRYDCFRAERDAQNFCRQELQDCRAACEQ